MFQLESLKRYLCVRAQKFNKNAYFVNAALKDINGKDDPTY